MTSFSSDRESLNLLQEKYSSQVHSLIKDRRKRRGCLSLIIGASVSALVALTIWGVVSAGISKNQKGLAVLATTAHFSHFSQSVQNACKGVHSPELCFATLSAYPDASGTTGFSNVAVSSAINGIGGFYNFAANLQVTTDSSGFDHYALSSCLQVLQDSQAQMQDSLSQLLTINSGNFKSQMTDVLTWMSAALTYHTTCLNGWEYTPGQTRDAMVTQGAPVEALVANAVSLVANLVGTLNSEEDIHNRRLLSTPDQVEIAYEMDSDEFPTWLRGVERRLLQQTTNLTWVDATVAQNGSAQYTSIQDAVNNAPQKSSKRYVIKIDQGTYYEHVVIPKNTTNIMFIGDGIGQTIITGDKSVVANNITTFLTATVAVSGMGFIARDITFQNTAGPANHQAVALRVESDKSSFFRCSIEAYQDTLYAHNQRQFYKNCTIYGTVDFIFGNAAVVFQNCHLLLRLPLSFQSNTVTAQGRTISAQNTGFSFQNCTIDAAPELVAAGQGIQSFLGRPWKLYSRTVFLESLMSNYINPAGWLEWNNTFALSTLFYGEYQNSGPGAAFAQRVNWATQITDPTVASKYTVSFIEGMEWLPQTNLDFAPNL